MKSLLVSLVALILIPFSMSKEDQKPTLIYVGDPMCSWCYGFAPEIYKTKEHFGDRVDFELVMGGLRPYNTETIADLGDFLSHHWKDVEKRSGQPFNYGILKDASFIYDTEPACRAVVVARSMNPEIEFAFFKDVQTMFYLHNKNTNDVNTYLEIAKKYKLNPEAFLQKFESEEYKQKVKLDFVRAQELKATGFPTALLIIDGKATVLTRGYTNSEQLIESIENPLKN